MYLQGTGASLSVAGHGVVRVEGNTAPYGGGLCPHSGATVAVEDGALLEVKGNEATTQGGGVYLQERRVEPHRQGQRNARSVGRKHRPRRWRAVSPSGATVAVEDGALLEVKGNEATTEGGGVYLQAPGRASPPRATERAFCWKETPPQRWRAVSRIGGHRRSGRRGASRGQGQRGHNSGRRRLPAGRRVEPHRQGQRNARSVGRKHRPIRWRAVSQIGGHRRSGRRGASRGQGQRGHNSGRRRLPAGRRVEPHRQGQRNARSVGRKHRPTRWRAVSHIGGHRRSGRRGASRGQGQRGHNSGRRRLPAGRRVEPHRQGQRNARSVGRKHRPSRWRAVSQIGGHRRSGRRGASRGQGQRGHNSGRRRLPAGRRVEPHRQGQRNARSVGRKHRPIGGGLFPNSGATVAVEDGALLEVKGNEATTRGGGVYLQDAGSSLTAKGNGTRVLLEGNTAPLGGGLCPELGATVAVEDGALLEVKGNEATTRGGGVYLQDAGSSLTVHGAHTRLLVLDNTASGSVATKGGGGGGIALAAGASLYITSPSIFRGNLAQHGIGGGIGVVASSDEDDGSSACVSVRLRVRSSNSKSQATQAKVYTSPPSALASDDWGELVNATDEQSAGDQVSDWCVPCGEYTLYAGTYYSTVQISAPAAWSSSPWRPVRTWCLDGPRA